MSKTSNISGHQFPGQHEGEAVQLVFHQHPLVMRKQLIGGLLAILFGVLPLDFPAVYESPGLADICIKIALGVPVLVLFFWFYRWVGWYYTVYILTDTRLMVIKQQGLFDRTVDEWRLDTITNVNYRIGGLQAVLFSYGDITARSYIGDLVLKTIHKPAEIHAVLLEAVRGAGGAAASSTPSDN